jgi:hypothetical protein
MMNSDVVHALLSLRMALAKHTGEDKPLISISVTPKVFDILVCNEFFTGSLSRFTPTDAARFEVCGIKIRPMLRSERHEEM